MMRFLFQRAIATAIGGAVIATVIAGATPSVASGNAKSEVTVKIEGMTCGGCESTIQEKVAASADLKDKVVSVKANATDGTARIQLKDGVSMTQAEIETAMAAALKDTSYTVGPTKKAVRKSK